MLGCSPGPMTLYSIPPPAIPKWFVSRNRITNAQASKLLWANEERTGAVFQSSIVLCYGIESAMESLWLWIREEILRNPLGLSEDTVPPGPDANAASTFKILRDFDRNKDTCFALSSQEA